MNRKARIKLRDLLIRRGVSEERVDGLILSGEVRVNGEVCTRKGEMVPEDARLELPGEKSYVSRSAHKLLGALKQFHLSLKDRICLDLGASHGGFTQVLLEKGASRVYALDVAYGILDYSLRIDPRVVVLERKNARHLDPSWFSSVDLRTPEGLFVTGDLSFISLKTVLTALVEFARAVPLPLECLLLIKPQFESSRETEGGILRDEVRRREIVENVLEHAAALGCVILGTAPSELKGSRGNQEYVTHMTWKPG